MSEAAATESVPLWNNGDLGHLRLILRESTPSSCESCGQRDRPDAQTEWSRWLGPAVGLRRSHSRTWLRWRHHRSAKTHGPQGHPYDNENTYTRRRGDGRVERHCKRCRCAAKRRHRATKGR